MAETLVESLVEIRQTLIFSALREAGFFIESATAADYAPGRMVVIDGTTLDHDLIRMVAVDEAISRWFGREMFTDATEAAAEAAHHVEGVGIDRLLREKGYLP
jgi:hypothetical protein